MKLGSAYWIIFSIFWLLRSILQWNLFFIVAFGFALCLSVYYLIVPSKKDEHKKSGKLHPKFTVALIILHLALFPLAFRIITVEKRPVLLLAQRAYTDVVFPPTADAIREDFTEAGKSPDRLTIRAIGSNSSGKYFLCEYEEPDGSVSRYYAFDKNDLAITIPAKVFWE